MRREEREEESREGEDGEGTMCGTWLTAVHTSSRVGFGSTGYYIVLGFSLACVKNFDTRLLEGTKRRVRRRIAQ